MTKAIIYKRFFYFLFMAIFLAGGVLYGLNYIKNQQLAKAVSGLPWQFGGTVTYYQPDCVSDPETGICANCPMCTSPGMGVGNYVCNAFQEIQFVPAGGSTPPNFICAPKGFVFWGGGTLPRVGGQIIGGGATNLFPKVIGISK